MLKPCFIISGDPELKILTASYMSVTDNMEQYVTDNSEQDVTDNMEQDVTDNNELDVTDNSERDVLFHTCA